MFLEKKAVLDNQVKTGDSGWLLLPLLQYLKQENSQHILAHSVCFTRCVRFLGLNPTPAEVNEACLNA